MAEQEELAPLERAKTITGLSKSAIYREIRAGTFPAPKKRGRKSLWPVSRLYAWVAQVIKEGDENGSGGQVGTG